VLKLFASRAQDVNDVEGIVIRNRDGIDWDYVERRLVPLIEAKVDRSKRGPLDLEDAYAPAAGLKILDR
jgi:hypothetical protein